MAIMGQSDVASYSRKEIRAFICDCIRTQVTLAPQTAVLPAGQVLGMITASQYFTAYSNAASDGTEVARVILADDAEISTVTQIVTVYLCGPFLKDQLVGLDAAAITDLGAREPVPNVLLVPGC